ncbi:MAG: AMP phosphorylase [Candidatus Thermoplasmatota archaeon]|jgi:AMP phosphorylase
MDTGLNGRTRLTARLLDVTAGGPEVFLRPEDAATIGVRAMDRVRVRSPETSAEFPAVVNIAEGFVLPGSIGLSRELAQRIQIHAAAPLEVRPAPRPESIESIRRKLDGRELSPKEVALVIHDIASGHLTAIELTCWAAGIHIHGMTSEETVACVQAMVDTGERIDWGETICYDVHSIGGVPGNKYAPIVVAIVASAGLKIPKTSSRAISSACGTADFMEVLAPVALDAVQLKSIANQVGATLAWGGGVSLAPADDEIIRVEYPLGLDPPAQVVASVLAKKVAMGVKRVLIDIPMGPGAKVHDQREADAMAGMFQQVGTRLGLDVRCEITKGGRPLGRAIGPLLEARELLQVLETGRGSADLVAKSCMLAGRLLEMGGKATAGTGAQMARSTLENGAALRKFLHIIKAQGGNADVKSKDLTPGPHCFEAIASHDGRFELDNASVVAIARSAGAPHAKGAGVLLSRDIGEGLRTGQSAFRVYAETASHLANAWDTTQRMTAFLCRSLAAQPEGA